LWVWGVMFYTIISMNTRINIFKCFAYASRALFIGQKDGGVDG